VHALLGAGDLDAARVDREAQVPELVGALLAEQGHLLVVVDREDEVGGVARGTTGVRERALVQEDEVGPAEAGEVADEAVAHDAGSDHDDLGAFGEITHGGAPYRNDGRHDGRHGRDRVAAVRP
jgi:hypothetical protein